MLEKRSNYYTLLKLCCFLIIAGNGAALLSGGSALHVLFSDDTTVQLIFGLALAACGTPLLLSTSTLQKTKLYYLVLPATVILFITSYASFAESGYLPEQLIEHAIKLLTPLLLFVSLNRTTFNAPTLRISLIVLISLTFIGHGMYAIGVHYVPNGFIDMTTGILGVSVSNAHHFLKVVGYIDIACAVLIFFNFPMKFVYFYLIIWGIVTALARLVYGVIINEGSLTEIIYWSSNMFYRLPHGLLAILLLQSTQLKKQLSLR